MHTTTAATSPTAPGPAPAETKLPRVTLLFWVMKICATTLGETAGDLVSMTLRIGYAMSSLLLVGLFVVTVTAQLRARRYAPALYWAVILSTSMAGTTMSDYLDRTLALGYARGSLLLVTILAGIFGVWRLTGSSFAVDNVRSFKVELLYWTAILFSNTLGTALGDYVSDASGLGFAGGALVIGGLLATVVLLSVVTRLSRVLLFWIAFVLTRPFGAELGDVLTKPHARGGLGLGTRVSSALLVSVLVALVAYAMFEQRAAKAREGPRAA